jgi:CheY-like chemotaxis protein
MPAMPTELQGLRILVVEDNFLVAESVRDLFDQCGCRIVGPVPRVEPALALIESEGLDGAVLDINLGSEFCFPIANLLTERGIPFLFLTGYDDAELIPMAFRDVPCLAKPFDHHAVALAAAHRFVRRES